jgi:hypothetical protein
MQLVNERVYLGTGGTFSLQMIRYSVEEIELLKQHLYKLPVAYHNHVNNLLSLIDTLQMPVSTTSYQVDVACKYLGFNRCTKTSLLVRLREAWRVLLGKPSLAYFTDEHGFIADGVYKEAIRQTVTKDNVLHMLPVIFATKFTEDYYIPVTKFIGTDTEVDELLIHFKIGV